MLILQAERDALLKPLLAVTGIVERRHTLPILSNVLIEKGRTSGLPGHGPGNPDHHRQQRRIAGRRLPPDHLRQKLQDILRAIPATPP